MNATLSCVILFASLGSAQAFEVVSVRPSETPGPIRMRGGPGTADPTRLTFENYPLIGIIARAYDLKDFQLSYPGWMKTTPFNIVAKVPAGATKQDMRVMLQHVLAERFKLKTHRESKEMQVLAMTLAKNGPKFTESPEVPPEPPDDGSPKPPPPLKADAKGYPVLAPEASMAMMGGMARLRGAHKSMSDLADDVSVQLRSPVVDETGLTAKYDFMLSWNAALTNGAPDPSLSETGPTLQQALEEQLGLKLVAKKMKVEVLVIDSALRVPTEN